MLASLALGANKTKKNKVKALKVIINVDVDVSAAVEYKPPLVK